MQVIQHLFMLFHAWLNPSLRPGARRLPPNFGWGLLAHTLVGLHGLPSGEMPLFRMGSKKNHFMIAPTKGCVRKHSYPEHQTI